MQISDKAKECLLQLLDKFVSVCEEYGLQYYLAGGSVLGAVRHKGFIPWDDDIDVHMPRKDYEKLQTLPQSVWGESMYLATWRKTKNYTYDFLKLELANTTVIERLHPNYVGGVFLDVFPLDFISEDQEEVASFESQYKKLAHRYIRCTIAHDNECQSIWELLSLKLNRLFYNHAAWLERWESLASTFGENQNKLCHSHGYFYYHGGMDLNWFGQGMLLEFEGRNVLVPLNYDSYLKHVFGDYMKLPPIEARVGHSFLYVNYDKRVSANEANDIFADLHKKHAYKFSLKREAKYILRKLKLLR